MKSKNQRVPQTALQLPPATIYVKILTRSIAATSSSSKNFLLGSVRSRNWSSLLEWSEHVRPQKYASAPEFYGDVQLAHLIKKYPFTAAEIPGLDPEGTAAKKFASAEHRCKWVNRKRRAKRTRFDPYMSFWEHARSYILRTIGESPDLLSIYDKCDFPSGASIGVNGDRTNIGAKLCADTWPVNPRALHYVTESLWAHAQVRDAILPGRVKCYDKDEFLSILMKKMLPVSYNKVAFVPKTARAHRAIAVEPLLNGWIQKGTDLELRSLLRKRGIDLSDQTKNQHLAMLGSQGGFNPYCTLDLKAASDTISFEVVKDLLPPDWFRYLDDIRSPSYVLPGSKVPTRYEKFCSMGNGFCFPLESLIFASFSYAAGMESSDKPYDFSVYGDDLIIRQTSALLLKEVLEEVGFQLNTEKSFFVGPFRESCGADWFSGRDVRPVTLDKRLVDLREVFALHNSFLRSPITEAFSTEVRSYLRSLSPKEYFRPGREPGDTCFSVPLDVAMSSRLVYWRKGTFSWCWKELLTKSVPDRARYPDEVKWLAIIRGAMSQQPLSLRHQGSVREKRICRPYFDKYHGGVKTIVDGVRTYV